MGSELSNRNNMIILRERVGRVVVDGGKKKTDGGKDSGRGLFILSCKYWRKGWSSVNERRC